MHTPFQKALLCAVRRHPVSQCLPIGSGCYVYIAEFHVPPACAHAARRDRCEQWPKSFLLERVIQESGRIDQRLRFFEVSPHQHATSHTHTHTPRPVRGVAPILVPNLCPALCSEEKISVPHARTSKQLTQSDMILRRRSTGAVPVAPRRPYPCLFPPVPSSACDSLGRGRGENNCCCLQTTTTISPQQQQHAYIVCGA